MVSNAWSFGKSSAFTVPANKSARRVMEKLGRHF
jgi:hypothetical protein